MLLEKLLFEGGEWEKRGSEVDRHHQYECKEV